MAREANGRPDSVQTARTMFDIVRRIKENRGVTLTEVVSEVDYAKSTVHRHLRTLEELEYVVQRDDGYHVGVRFLDIGVTARNSYDGYKLIHNKLEEIADETGERAQFFSRNTPRLCIWRAPSVSKQFTPTRVSGVGFPCMLPLRAKQSWPNSPKKSCPE